MLLMIESRIEHVLLKRHEEISIQRSHGSAIGNTYVVTLLFASIQCYKQCHSSMHLITLNSQNITGFQSKHLMKMQSTFMEENSALWKIIPHSWKTAEKSCPRMRILRF